MDTSTKDTYANYNLGKGFYFFVIIYSDYFFFTQISQNVKITYIFSLLSIRHGYTKMFVLKYTLLYLPIGMLANYSCKYKWKKNSSIVIRVTSMNPSVDISFFHILIFQPKLFFALSHLYDPISIFKFICKFHYYFKQTYVQDKFMDNTKSLIMASYSSLITDLNDW